MTAAPDKDNADLGLNLVFSTPASLSSAQTLGGSGIGATKKPKRKTKYDRRRERGRLAKLAKETERDQQSQQRQSHPRGVDGGSEKGEENNNVRKESSLAGIAAMLSSNRGLAANAKDKQSSIDTGVAPSVESRAAKENDVMEINDEKPKTSSEFENLSRNVEETVEQQSSAASSASQIDNGQDTKESDEFNDTKTDVRKSTSSSSLPSVKSKQQPEETLREDTKLSSRRHREQIPQTEEQRSQYLSEFHARPRDLDRSEGASKSIKVSCASDHIFGGADVIENEDDGSDGDGTSNEKHDGKSNQKHNKDMDGTSKATPNNNGSDAKLTCPFQKLGLHSNLVTTLTSPTGKFRLSQPTIVQSRSIAALLPKQNKHRKKIKNTQSKRNLFIQSETGSGKTLAYLLPILQQLAVDCQTHKLKKVDRQLGGTRSILLCPTRELATQTHIVATNLCNNSFPWIVPGCFSGGEKRKSEKARLRKGVTILIATPGRLLDHLSKTESLLSALKNKLEWIILDEADRLLDAGLGGQVEQIVQHLRSNQPGAGPKRDGVSWRSVLVSATVTGELEGLAKTVLGSGEGWVWARGHKNDTVMTQKSLENDDCDDAKSPLSSDQGTSNNNNELDNAAPRQLAQLYMVVSAKLRLSSLVAFLSARADKGERTVVFLSTCDSVDYHHALFTEMDPILGDRDDDKDDGATETTNGIFGRACPIYKLHGDIPHNKRQSTLKAFSNDHQQSAILLATDVAARGLNFPSLDWIVQYDPPCETKDYVHRAGRSARAGKAGHALLFLLPSERQYVEVLQLRGLQEISALSLSATLTTAAEVCPSLAREGEAKAAGNKFSDSRGEAFTSAIQNRLEQCVLQNDIDYKAAMEKKFKANKNDSKQGNKRRNKQKKKDTVGPLLEGARKAFSAFVRAYPAKEKAVRHIFNARALHLGHVARSLALKETPKMVSKGNNSNSNANGNGNLERKESAGGKGEKRKSRLAFGEQTTSSEKNNGDMGTIDDEEQDRNISLLGDAIGRASPGSFSSSKRSLQHGNKKFKPSSTGGGSGSGKDVQRRMMEAAMMMQAQEFM